VKIAAYVVEKHAKQAYKNESIDGRAFIGFKMILDSISRAGYDYTWAGKDTIHKYDIVLVSITSDFDWWTFLKERLLWKKKNYIVIAGGAGVLNIRPLLPFVDFFVLGAGQKIIVELLNAIKNNQAFQHNSVIESETFNIEKDYYINQEPKYPYEIKIDDNYTYKQEDIGCNHKCMFCGYTWHRKRNNNTAFKWDATKYDISNAEAAILDYYMGLINVDFSKLISTAIDGFSERLRFFVNKKISKEILNKFLKDMIACETAKPHKVKFFNLVGLPTETKEDWKEFIENLDSTKELSTSNGKQWGLILHSTPFRAMPGTPMATAPVSYKNYRKEISKYLGAKYKGNIIYKNKVLWAVESMGTESLSTVIESMIMHRGTEEDTENILKLCKSKKYWNSSSIIKQKTLEKYFDVYKLFQTYNAQTLPNRYIKTYAQIEKIWEVQTWQKENTKNG
jgi:radical SAM superfamily enzyme YgiQ (UPF0313 family)